MDKDEKNGNNSNSNIKLFRKHIDQQSYLRINRTFQGKEDNIAGFVLQASSRFVLLHKAYDFRLDGYYIIPVNKMDGIRHSTHERALKRI